MDAFIDRYVSMWNEADPARRHALIAALWTPDGANYTKAAEHHGHDALEKRVTASWEKSVRNAGCLFRARRYDVHHDAVRFVWEMVDAQDGRVRATGTEFLRLNAEGKIREDYQFVEPA
jgi:nuclear transport factor 2 (NTF2) superfamily protein